MSWIRERLISAAAPLLTAVTGRKKTKRVKKAARKSKRAAFTRAAAKRSARLRAQRGKAKRSTAKLPARLPKNNSIKLPVPIPVPREEPIVKPAPPTGRAILISPENGKYVDNLNPSFRWLSVGGATRYEVAWGEEDHSDSGNLQISISTEAAVPVEKPLRLGGAYFWRVRGGNEAGWGPWSPPSIFRVVAEPLVN